MRTPAIRRLPSFVPAVLLASVLASGAHALTASACPADLNGDRIVDGFDLSVLLGAWGPCNQPCAADLNGDGIVDGGDLAVLLGAWGSCDTVTPAWATLIEAVPDPAVVTNPELRAAIVASGLSWRVRDTATQIEMLLVPPGTFQMGCTIGSDLYGCINVEVPAHQVTLTRPFYLGRYEVTQAQWQARMGSNPSFFQDTADAPNCPVEQVNWNSIQGFLSATGMRVPTEAEWEFACRAGTATPFYNGLTDDYSIADLAWWTGNADSRTHPVGRKAPNALGFHDMIGNVFEQVSDFYDVYSTNPQRDPVGPPGGPAGGVQRVVRGSAFVGFLLTYRSSFRAAASPDDTQFGPGLGLRVARNP